jgi:zinc ribbon protein
VNQVLELVIAVILAAAAIYFVLQPVFGPRRPAPVDDDSGIDPDDDLSPRAVALRALKEIEFDRATGKLTDADYDALKHRYTAEAVQALRVEEIDATTPAAAARIEPSGERSCPAHGPRPEAKARYCSECGRGLERAQSYCTRCGSGLESGARFCSSCGRRAAA